MDENTFESLKSGQTYSPTSIARVLHKNPSTIWRWMNKGVAVHGQRLRLTATRVGGRIHITEDDINAFLQSLNQLSAEDDSSKSPPSSDPSAAEQYCRANHI